MGGKSGAPPSTFTGGGGPTGAAGPGGTTFSPQWGGYVPSGATPLYPVGGRAAYEASQQPAAPQAAHPGLTPGQGYGYVAPYGENAVTDRSMDQQWQRDQPQELSIQEQVQAALAPWLANLPQGFNPWMKQQQPQQPQQTPAASEGYSQGAPPQQQPVPAQSMIKALRRNWE